MTLLRKLCLWLAMLALPLQGLAAASMMHRAAQSAQRMEAGYAENHHSIQGTSHPEHEHAAQHVASSPSQHRPILVPDKPPRV